MTKSVIPRKKGDKYQALFFWVQAAKILSNAPIAARVGYEITGQPGFDDVAIYYDPPKMVKGLLIGQDFFQLKFHADHRNGINANSLISTEFIGTQEKTLLGRLFDIYNLDIKSFEKSRFYFVTTWGLQYEDGLASILKEDGSINCDKLKKGGPKSRLGKIRHNWMNHLGVDEVLLFTLLKSLRITFAFTVEALNQQLNDALEAVGLIKIDHTQRSSRYADLIYELHEEGKTEFTREDLLAFCTRENLLAIGKSAHSAMQNDSVTYDQIKLKFQEQVKGQLSRTYFALKYYEERYISRDIENDVSKWLAQPAAKSSTAYLILAAAGSGKTNLLSRLATLYAQKQPTFLIAAPLIKIGDCGLWEPVYDFLQLNQIPKNRNSIKNYFKAIFGTNGHTAVFVIDAINEYQNPSELKNELDNFLAEASDIGFSVIISCRDFYWGLFDSDWWSLYLKSKGEKSQSLNKKHLGNYSTLEAQQAFQRYFSDYNITARPTGNALEQFKHPLLLRFFCETYHGLKIGELRDVRLKDLFDTYWEKKLDSIAERMINQGTIERVSSIKNHLGDKLKGIALMMLEQNTRAIDENDVRTIMQSESLGLLLATPLGRIIDEHIILEEIDVRGYDSKVMIAFVFEEFMEYSMARSLYSKWLDLPVNTICDHVKELTEKYGDFNQIFGVLLYVALMLREKRNIALWPSLILKGDLWQQLVIEAFKKLPQDQIDDGVFHAIVELLESKNEQVQVATLELLKFGRLKRDLPVELLKAVGKLVTHKKLNVSRRAIIVLNDFPPSATITLVEQAVSKSRSRQDHEATIVKNSVKVLAGVHTEEAMILLCKICGGFWRLYNEDEVIQKLGIAVKMLLPLLNNGDILVRLGATKLVGFTDLQPALDILQNKINQNIYSTRVYKKDELPPWAKSLGNFLSPIAIGKDDEKRSIEEAIKRLTEAIKKTHFDSRWRKKVREVKITKEFDDLPQLIEDLNSYYSNIILAHFIIQSGLEIRSQKKWRLVRDGFSDVLIRAPHTRLKNERMTDEDTIELAGLLGLEKLNHAGYEIRVGLNDYHYWKEYMYRAWGFVPPVLGYTEYYD